MISGDVNRKCSAAGSVARKKSFRSVKVMRMEGGVSGILWKLVGL